MFDAKQVAVKNIITLELVADGVIAKLKPVTSTKLVDVVVKFPEVSSRVTTCKILPPPAGAAHFKPVGETELSATR